MATEFDFIFEEFAAELNAIGEMALGAQSGSAKSRIAAGNGATLLLAAVFEEFVRQQVKAAYREQSRSMETFKELSSKLASTIWRRAFDKFGRTPLEVFEADITIAQSSFNSIVGFCIKKDSSSDVAEFIAHNENNMRLAQMNSLFKSIGLSNVSREIAADARMIEFLGCEDAAQADQKLQIYIEIFFKRRNEIAHAIKMGSSSGPTDLENDIALFRQLADSLTRHLVTFFANRRTDTVHFAAMQAARPARARNRKKTVVVEQGDGTTVPIDTPMEGQT